MTIAFVVTLVLLALVSGYSARQMQDERENEAKIEGLRDQVESMRGKPSVIEEQAYKIEEQEQTITRLRRENANLAAANADHVSNLEMVLDNNADESA
jgi:TolA-binding protein